MLGAGVKLALCLRFLRILRILRFFPGARTWVSSEIVPIWHFLSEYLRFLRFLRFLYPYAQIGF